MRRGLGAGETLGFETLGFETLVAETPVTGRQLARNGRVAGRLAGGIEAGDIVDAIGTVGAGTGSGPVVPALRAPMAQPEDAGPGVGRIGHRVDELPLLAAMEHRALDRAAPADRALIEGARHLGVGHDPAGAHRGGEFGNVGDPVVDGARRHGKEAGEFCVGRAEQAVIMGQLTEFGLVAGGASHGAHGRGLFAYRIGGRDAVRVAAGQA